MKTPSEPPTDAAASPAAIYHVTVNLRSDALAAAAQATGIALPVALIKACGLALAKHPGVYRAKPGRGKPARQPRLDLGIAWMSEDADAANLTLTDVAGKDLDQLQTEWGVARATAGKPAAAARQAPGFTLVDMRASGIDHATALPAPGNAATLTIAMPNDLVLALCLSADAHLLNKSQSAAFMNELRNLLERPEEWLLRTAGPSPVAGKAAHAATPRQAQVRAFSSAIPAGDWDVQVAIIGGGPGGEDCARALADHGVRVALINDAPLPGGECLWRGCIPSKAWRHSADMMRDRKHDADKGVLGTNQAMLDWSVLEAHRREVQESRGEMALRADKGMKIAVHEGRARFLDAHSLEVQPRDEEAYRLSFAAAVIATGAPPYVPPIPGAREGLANGGVLTSNSIWNLPGPPRKLGIIGGGVIGIEMAQIWHDFGTHVLVLEGRERILAETEEEIGKQLADIVSVEVDVVTSTRIGMITGHPGNMMIQYTDAGGARHQFLCDYVLIATGKRPATADLDLAAAGVALADASRPDAPIQVDAQCRTNVPHILAVGDVNGGLMLAHTAAAQGRVAAETLLGMPAEYNPDLDCGVTFSRPQAGFVGLSAAQAKARGLDVMEAKMPLAIDAKAMISLETQGLIKLVADKASQKIIGVHFLAEHTDTLIGAAVMMVSGGMTLTQVAQAIFPHPTQTELFGELARRLLARLRRSARKQ